jgi:hypothetical protein
VVSTHVPGSRPFIEPASFQISRTRLANCPKRELCLFGAKVGTIINYREHMVC